MEVTGKTSLLPRDLRNVLSQVDGKATVGDLHQKLDKFSEQKLIETLGKLSKDGFVREFVSAPASISPPSQVPIVQEDIDLDFTALISKPPTKAEVTAQTKAEADEVARQVAQAREKQQTDARGKQEAEARAKREAEEKTKREAAERARKEAEEKAKREAEEKAKREAAERARKESEEKAKREAAERARKEADERARRELEQRSKQAESQARVDAEARARAEAEAEAREEAEARARLESEERAKREAEERSQREQEERIRRELEERVRRAEEQAKREADERAKRDAAERERREEAERARREAESRSRREAEERTRREAEERSRRETEERAEREAEEERRREAEESGRRRQEEERARRDAERKAREEDKARAKAEAESAARARREERAREKAVADSHAKARQKEQERDAADIAARLEKIKTGRKGGFGKYIGIAAAILVAAGLVYVQFFMPLDVAHFERLAAEGLGQPVKISAGHVSLLPSPAVRFEGVTVGKDGNVKIAVAAAHPDFVAVIGGQPQLKSIDLEGVTLDAAGLGAVLFGRPQSAALGLERVRATGVKLVVPGLTLPELEATATLASTGAVQKMVVHNPNKTIAAQIQPRGGSAEVELTVGAANTLLGLPFDMDSLTVRGVATATEFEAAELDGKLLDGVMRGKGTLRWPGSLAFDGSFELKQLDAKRVTTLLVGRMQGSGVVAARGESLEKLAAAARLDGNFAVAKGQIAGVDLPRTMQSGKSVSGSTNFNELTAQAQLDQGKLALRNVKIDGGAFLANGTVDIADAGKSLAGRFAADMKTPGGVVRATLFISGSTSQLSVKR